MNVLRHDQAAPDPSVLGGKGANLARLRDLGARVPPWVCLAARPPEAGLLAEDEGALLAEVDRLFPGGARLAVRSSAVAEDSARDSFAGQMETFLHVSRSEVAQRVRDVLASASSDRARAYREARGVQADARAAVLVQLMVDARCSGVLFTADPMGGDLPQAVISAALGLGEGVVADKVETDTYYAELASGTLRSCQIVSKRTKVAFDRERGTGTVVVQVPPEEGDRPALSEAEVRALVGMAREVAAKLGGPQDIEWAIDQAGVIHLLQTRPITTLDREQIFDNSNIVESYPGISLPLTFSFARHAYEETFREASRRFGTSERVLDENRQVHANLIGLIDGRIYYNILHWYRLFQLLPGFEALLPAWEKALGLPPRAVPPRRNGVSARLARFAGGVTRVSTLLWRLVGLGSNVQRYQRTFQEVREEFRRRDLSTLSAHQLFDLYEMLSRRLLRGYAVSLENDLFAQQFYELVAKLIARWELGDPMALRNDLFCGEKGMESVEPVRSALGLAERVRRSPRLSRLLEAEGPEAEVWEALRTDLEFRDPLREHLDRFGDRTLQELKLETPIAEDEPSFFVSMLRNLVRGGQRVEDMEARERQIRDAAERTVAEKLQGRIRKMGFGFVLRTARLAVRQREDLRLTRSRAFGMVKRVFRAIGRIFTANGLIDGPLDVFWLTVEEVEDVLRARMVTRDIRMIVARRKQEYEVHRARTPASRVTTRGIPYRAPFEQVQPPTTKGSEVLRGIGCSPGRVRAKAKVVLEADRGVDVRGEILVAPMTDPGWVFLMVASGGLVVEKGSVLSHTAIIGRELGIPTVVAVKDATRLIPDGALLELDGQAGTVRVLPPEGA